MYKKCNSGEAGLWVYYVLYYIRLEETKEELEEYQISSRELEAELETQLKQLEKRNKELDTSSSRLQAEVESLKVSPIVVDCCLCVSWKSSDCYNAPFSLT